MDDGFCSCFEADSAGTFSALSHPSSYRAGEELLGQGEESGRVGVISRGLVKVFMLTDEGKEMMVQLLRPGQIVGVPSHQANDFGWATATDASVCWIPKSAWQRFLDERPRHFKAYLTAMLTQLDEMRLSVARLRGRNSQERVGLWILDQIPNATSGDRPKVRISLARRDLASLLDMSVETLCRALHQLDDRKAIRILAGNLVEVVDIVKLRVLAKFSDDDQLRPVMGPDAHRSAEWSGRMDTGQDARSLWQRSRSGRTMTSVRDSGN